MKSLFIPCYFKRNPIPAVRKALKRLKNYKRVGLLTTAQHLNQLEKISNFLKKNNKKPIIGGQVLGCNQDSAMAIENTVDAFLYIGSGRFHPLGIALATEKPVFIANPYSGSVDEISDDKKNFLSGNFCAQSELCSDSGEKKRFIRKRKGQIARALTAEIFGILISTKTKQFNLKSALKIKEKIENSGRKAFLFAGDELSPDRLLGYKVDAWINTACPRIIDDEFDRPMLNPDEVKIIL